MAVLAYSRGIGSTPISSFLDISAKSMFRFWKLFRTGGTQKLFERRPRSDKKSNNEAIKRAVFELLHSPPSAHGLNRTTWRQTDLRDVLRDEYNDSINCETIHTIIKEAGWQWRHARTVLTSNDPDYAPRWIWSRKRWQNSDRTRLSFQSMSTVRSPSSRKAASSRSLRASSTLLRNGKNRGDGDSHGRAGVVAK